ncbi:MAG: prepilin-type N-terminal cleavage/methylation domain-containing protein [Candidatus Binatia bacterium]|nr:prepilin-type N-terminal cleavage/methylation domain-containing protein [Candidatus Binatia bacterium]
MNSRWSVSGAQRRTGDVRGLTLIEVLVALTIASIFALALYGFYSFHVRVLKAEQTRLSVQEGARLAIDFLVRELRFAGARPVRDGPCAGFAHLTRAEGQAITLQYDFRGNTMGTPPDGCPDDPLEIVSYTYDASGRLLRRATGGGAPQPFVADVPAGGFLLRYFDRDGNELVPPLAEGERAAVRSVMVSVQTSRPHPDPRIAAPITASFSSMVFLPNPSR